GRKSNCANSQHHQDGASNDLRVGRDTAALQLTKNQNAPQQTPQLIRIGERNAPADAYILSRVLLKDITDHPNKAAQHQPKKNVARARQFAPQRTQAEIADERARRSESTRLNSSHVAISYAVFCLKKK